MVPNTECNALASTAVLHDIHVIQEREVFRWHINQTKRLKGCGVFPHVRSVATKSFNKKKAG